MYVYIYIHDVIKCYYCYIYLYRKMTRKFQFRRVVLRFYLPIYHDVYIDIVYYANIYSKHNSPINLIFASFFSVALLAYMCTYIIHYTYIFCPFVYFFILRILIFSILKKKKSNSRMWLTYL